MKFIISGGTHTKNTPSYSLNSILLATKTDFIDGVELNIHITKDNQLVVSSNNIKEISNMTLEEIKRIELGSMIKRHTIPTLEQILNYFNNLPDILILNIENTQDKNQELVNNLINTIYKYPNVNLYIKSNSKEIILLLKDLNQNRNIKIGAVIDNESDYFWNQDLDFYSLVIPNINIARIIEKLHQRKEIMIEQIDTIQKLAFIQNLLNDLTNNIYLITNSFDLIQNINKK